MSVLTVRERTVTVQELMDVLKQLAPDSPVMVWNSEWDAKNRLAEIEVDQDGDIVIF